MYLGIGTLNNMMAQIFIDACADYIICQWLIEEVAFATLNFTSF